MPPDMSKTTRLWPRVSHGNNRSCSPWNSNSGGLLVEGPCMISSVAAEVNGHAFVVYTFIGCRTVGTNKPSRTP
eukprot:2687180-Amphidinium_carterae.2